MTPMLANRQRSAPALPWQSSGSATRCAHAPSPQPTPSTGQLSQPSGKHEQQKPMQHIHQPPMKASQRHRRSVNPAQTNPAQKSPGRPSAEKQTLRRNVCFSAEGLPGDFWAGFVWAGLALRRRQSQTGQCSCSRCMSRAQIAVLRGAARPRTAVRHINRVVRERVVHRQKCVTIMYYL